MDLTLDIWYLAEEAIVERPEEYIRMNLGAPDNLFDFPADYNKRDTWVYHTEELAQATDLHTVMIEACEAAFAEYNLHEHPFLRSMSIGDVVVIGESHFVCLFAGWSGLTHEQESTTCVPDN